MMIFNRILRGEEGLRWIKVICFNVKEKLSEVI